MSTGPAFRRTFLAPALLAALAGATVALAQEPPAPPACGATIVADTTLRADLLKCPDNGLVIGADGVTLDLDGHAITGDGKTTTTCPQNTACDIGVLANGHDGVVVRNGSVRRFDTGVLIARAQRARIQRVTSTANRLFGFVVAQSSRSVVRDSSGSGNLAPEGDGLGLFGSRDVRVLSNLFSRNAQLGIHVDHSSHNLIQANGLIRNHDFGMLVEASTNRINHNRCRHNGACINVATGVRNVLSGNRSTEDGAGLSIENGRRNVIGRNVVVRPRGPGIYLGLNDPPIGGGRNLVFGNEVVGAGRDGFAIRRTDHGSRVGDNVARRSADDGFDVRSASTWLGGNRAFGNADFGIDAVAGVTDVGGNVARRNGDRRQCRHVACR